jgi:hypothetical protein
VKQRSFGRVLSGHDLEQRLALLWRGALVDDRLNRSVSFVQRPGKIDSDGERETVEPDLPEVTLLDVHGNQSLAPAFGGRRIEVAGAAIFAAAVLEPLALQTPICSGHRYLPFCARGRSLT